MNPTELERREMMHCQDGVCRGTRGPLEVWIQQKFGTPRLVVPPPLVEISARHWMCRPRKGNVYRRGAGPSSSAQTREAKPLRSALHGAASRSAVSVPAWREHRGMAVVCGKALLRHAP
jgi:hypothetical protein